MTGFGQTVFGKAATELETLFAPTEAKAIAILKNSIEAVEKVIVTEGPEAAELIFADMASSVASSLTAGLTKPGAAKAAVQALVKIGENVAIPAVEKIGSDAANAVATSLVTTPVTA